MSLWHFFTKSQNRPLHWAEGYGNYLKFIHLHSNDGSIDQHIAFTRGNVNFEGFFEYIRTLSSPPDLIIEVGSRDDFLTSLAALRQMGF